MLRDKKGLTEAEYIEIYKTKNYPKPALTADVILLGDQRSRLLLIKRGGHPFIGQWAFPGGFALESEPVEKTAARELEEETGLPGIIPRLAGVFSKPGRDPRGWVVSVAFLADVNVGDCKVLAGDDAAKAEWFFLKKAGRRITLKGETSEIAFDYAITEEGIQICFLTSDILAFDHAEMLVRALEK